MDEPEAEQRANELLERVVRPRKPATRRCLKCGKPFDSVGFHHRLCDKHRPKDAGMFENVQTGGNWIDGTTEPSLRQGED